MLNHHSTSNSIQLTMLSSLGFKVETNKPELIKPSKPTPHEFKTLSDLDNQPSTRTQSRGIALYQNDGKMDGKDPVRVIKQAVADALVHYYPLAGRIREGGNGKLTVECTGEGTLFVEAHANITLDQLISSTALLPPVPGAKDLLQDVPESANILHSPLVLHQVTRFKCGGFASATRVNHAICDAYGFTHFLLAIAEMARGAPTLSISPVWERKLLNARDVLQISCEHHVYERMKETKSSSLLEENIVECSFFFGPQEISTLKRQLRQELRKSSRFEILSALFWRCRTIAQEFNSEDVVCLAFSLDVRNKLNPPLPLGYYGNACVKPVASSTAGELSNNSLGYALELVRKAKEVVTDEFVRSTIDFLEKNDYPTYATGEFMFYVSNLTNMSYKHVDFGVGKVVYGGTLSYEHPSTFFCASRNNKGEDGIASVIGLPGPVMKRFIIEIEKMVRVPYNINTSFIWSTL